MNSRRMLSIPGVFVEVVTVESAPDQRTHLAMSLDPATLNLTDPRAVLDLAASLEEWGFAEIERREGFAEAKRVKEERD